MRSCAPAGWAPVCSACQPPCPHAPTPSSVSLLLSLKQQQNNVPGTRAKRNQDRAAKRSAPEVPRGLVGSQGVNIPAQLTQSLWESKWVHSTSWRLCWLGENLLSYPQWSEIRVLCVKCWYPLLKVGCMTFLIHSGNHLDNWVWEPLTSGSKKGKKLQSRKKKHLSLLSLK